MNKQTVGYSESQELINPITGRPMWKKVWHELEIDRDEDKDAAFNDVQSFVQNKFHKDNNPQLTDTQGSEGRGEFVNAMDLYSKMPAEFSTQPLKSIDRKAIDELEIKIDNATTPDEVRGYEEEARRLGLFVAYYNKLQLLTHKPTPINPT